MPMTTRSLRAAGAGLPRHLAALLLALVFLLPLLWVVSASLRQPGLPPPRTVEWLPQPLAWGNYPRIFGLVPLGRYLVNSLLVVALAVPLTLVSASWAGLAMAQLHARLQRWLVLLAIALLLVPATALWLTRYVLFARLGLTDTFWPLIAPALMGTSPLFVLLFYWTFRRVPYELWDSAQIDGAGTLRTWAAIALPLARPTVIVVGVLSFVQYWSDYVSPLLYLKAERRYTLPVGLQLLQQMDRTNWPLLMAGSVCLLLPVVLLFVLTQRYFWPESHLGGLGNR